MIELTARNAFDRDTLMGLLRQSPADGVLSIYVNADSRSDPGLQGAGIDIRNRLAQLERNLAAEGPPERGRALTDGFRRLGSEIERITNPQERGRGRALFAPLGGGQVTRFASQMPVANRVVLDKTAFVHPLLELLDEGRPAGVVLVSQDEARLLEWRLGEVQELDRMQPAVVEAPHERSGPVGTSPAPRAYTPKGEQRAARERERTLRFLDRVGAFATALAGEHGWERVLVSGGERLTEPLAARLKDSLVRDPRLLIQLDEAALSETVTERLRAEHAEREQRLLREVRGAALGAGGGAVGLSDVVGALNQGRVAHLVYDPEVRYQGSIGSHGTLHAGDEHAGEAPTTPEPRLTERLVERALDTGARVTPVEGAAGAALAEAEGIAALLRW
jgi:Bacterial archaeo-eukaryotic release factor family 10